MYFYSGKFGTRIVLVKTMGIIYINSLIFPMLPVTAYKEDEIRSSDPPNCYIG
jgi:hypothetical protein